MDVGIRELKEHLSAYLARVERGETLTITDRGVPKAVLAPVSNTGRLRQGIDEGWVRPAQRHGLAVIRRAGGRGSVMDELASDRGA